MKTLPEHVLLTAEGFEWLRDEEDTSPYTTRGVLPPRKQTSPTLDKDAFDALVDRFLSLDGGAPTTEAGDETTLAGNLADAKTAADDHHHRHRHHHHERACTSCKRRRLGDEDFEPDRKTCRECLRKQRRRHARKVRSALEARMRRNARETTATPG